VKGGPSIIPLLVSPARLTPEEFENSGGAAERMFAFTPEECTQSGN
jgi:hypothetical protein